MKKLFCFFVTCLFLHQTVLAQTAVDWTKTDCSGNTHNLYTYLNSEEVVIMEFAMGCGSCTNAATYLLSIKDKYAVSNPGRVNVFYLDYWAGNDCSPEIIAATNPYAFDATFDHCIYDKDDYYPSTSSPMPGIVIVAGSFHQIIYQKNSFSLADTLLIEQAITAFFATAVVEENALNNSVSISPNPSDGEFILDFNNPETQNTEISLFNLNGQLISEVLNENIQTGSVKIKMDLSRYPKGIYYLTISNSKETVNKKIIIL